MDMGHAKMGDGEEEMGEGIERGSTREMADELRIGGCRCEGCEKSSY